MEETWEVASAVVGREGKVDLLARMVVVVAGKKRTKVEGKMRTRGTGGAGEMSFLVGQWLGQTACYWLAFIIALSTLVINLLTCSQMLWKPE